MKKILSVGLFVLLGMSMFAFGAKENRGLSQKFCFITDCIVPASQN